MDALLRRIPAKLLREWMAYDRMDPIGPERADLRAGQIAAAVLNSQRTRGSKLWKAQDFMPFSEKPAEPERTWQDQLKTWRQISALHNRKVQAKEKKAGPVPDETEARRN